MGVVENIMSAVILMFILLISGLVYMGSFAHDAIHNAGVKEDVFFDDAHINNLNNLLKITEPESKRTIGVLLADAVYYRNNTLEFNNKTINVTEKVENLLELSFGTNKYYLEIKPRIIEVSLNFIIDGSPSLNQERTILSQNLGKIITSIEKKLNETNAGYEKKVTTKPVRANIYILGSKEEKCEIFDNLSNSKIGCQILSEDKLYLTNTSINTSDVFINNSQYNLDSFLNYYNMTPPFGFEWLESSYYAPTSDYYESDWGFGTGYASNFALKTSLAKLTILFPMSDELSTSSFPDDCFFINGWPEWVTCTICTDDCPTNRSLKSVEKGIKIAKENNHVINPIFSYSCDFEYDLDFNVGYDNYYGNSEGTTTMVCEESNCPGCETSGSDVCFHPTCSDSIIEQMQMMADQTGGNIIDLADIETMDLNITDTITQNIDQYLLKVGDLNKNLERDVIETTQPLPNGELVDIRLWVYKN
jgi:hypothetical protein